MGAGEEARSRRGALDRENPYPGLLAFTEDDAEFFFGRKQEEGELFRLVKREVLTVCFGASGLGKTSLLAAGLFPRLRRDLFFPIPLRLNLATDDGDLAAQILRQVAREVEERQVEAEAARDGETLWEYFHRAHFWDRRNRLLVPVLAFDQLEEIFTLGADDPRIAPLLVQLADLVENRIPESERSRFADPDTELPFSIDRQHFKVLFSFREDYLPHFEELRPLIPALGHERFRLTAMNGLQARDAVLEPAGGLVESAVATEIVYFAAGAKHQATDDEAVDEELRAVEVEPALLALVCRKLNDRRKEMGRSTITSDLLSGGRDRIYTDFYDEAMADAPPGIRTFVEDRLLTPSGFRTAAPLEEATRLPGVERPAIDKLVDRRVLRLGERLGIAHIELIHDVLTRVVRESRDRRYARQRRAKLRRRAAAAGIAVLVLFLLGFFIAQWRISLAQERAAQFEERANLYMAAEKARREAEEARAEAEKQRNQAERAMLFTLFMSDQFLGLGKPYLLENLGRDLEYYVEDLDDEFSRRIRSKARFFEGAAALERAKNDADEAVRALLKFELQRAAAEIKEAEGPDAFWSRELATAEQGIGDSLDALAEKYRETRYSESARKKFDYLISRTSEDYRSALAGYRELFAAAPDRAQAEFRQLRDRHYESALQRFRRLFEGEGSGKWTETSVLALVGIHVRRGDVAAREGRAAEALDAYSAAQSLVERHYGLSERRMRNQLLRISGAIQKLVDSSPSLAAPASLRWEYALVHDFLDFLEGPEVDPDLLERLYAERVDYHSNPRATHADIRTDKERYVFARWSELHHGLTGEVTIGDTGSDDERVLSFNTQFDTHSSERGDTRVGTAANTLRVRMIDGRWKIVTEKSKVLSRE